MQVALIPPKALLEDTELTSMQLFLPHLLEDKEYFDKFEEFLLKPWVTTILDNGAAEALQLTDIQFRETVLKLRPTEFALPDVLGNGPATVARALDFGDLRRFALNKIKVGFVAQGTTEEEAWWSVTKLLSYAVMKDHVKVIYLPRLLVAEWDREIRIRLAQRIKAEFPHLEIHLFGANNIWAREVLWAASCKVIRSIDTSLPYQAAYANRRLRNLEMGETLEGVKRPSNYFAADFSDPELRMLVTANVRTYLGWANGQQS